jgi:polysaccharide export outer membrane protein
MIMKKAILIVLFLVLLPAVVRGGDYIISEGDTLNISVWGNKELSAIVKVRPDGKISLPALGELHAADLTPLKLQNLLTEKMKRLVRDPLITVTIDQISNNKVYIFGGGVKATVFDLTRRTTLLQLLCVLGDLNNADLHEAYVLRNGEKIKKDFYRLFVKGRAEEDLLLNPNDVVFFPAVTDNNIYVIGAVNTPKPITYREGMTVMEAILQAGGFTKYAKENATEVLRKDSFGRQVTIPVKLKRLIADGDLNQNLALKPGDYIVVSEGLF